MILSLERQLDALAEYAVGDFHRTRLGLETIDNLIGGPAPGELLTITGRSFTGKSIVAQNVVLNNPKVPSIFFSLEMPANQALIRLYSMWSGVDSKEVQKVIDAGKLPDNLYDVVDAFPYHRIVDTPGLGLDRMSDAIKAYQDDLGTTPEFAIIDYLELVGRDRSQDAVEGVQNSITAVRDWGRSHNLRVFLIHQSNMSAHIYEPPTENSPRYAGMAQSDFLLGVWRPHRDPNITEADKRYLSNKFMINVLKNRAYFESHEGVTYTCAPSLRLLEGDVYVAPRALYASGGEDEIVRSEGQSPREHTFGGTYAPSERDEDEIEVSQWPF